VTPDPLRVEIDSQIFLAHEVGGISRYFVELIRGLKPDRAITLRTPYRYVTNRHLIEMDRETFRPPPALLAGRTRGLEWLNRAVVPRSPVPELVHHTYYQEDRLLRAYPGAARVCTVYDMIPEIYPQQFGHTTVHQAKHRYIAEVDGILCISHTTRNDLERICGPQDKPVEVVPLAVADDFGHRSVAPRIPGDYLLFVGRRGGYKNFRLLLDAFVTLAELHPDLHLVCAGTEALTEAEVEPAMHVRDRVHHLSPTDAELAGLYQHAAAFVFPSTYEGFGLPVLEAFTSGCPVVVADTPALEEVAAGAAEVVQPADHGQLAEVLDALLGDPAARRTLVDAGRHRVQDFSWRNVAEATSRFYRQVHASSR
jgi:glycosyltransferase involved in cell wall biosynthesis